MRFQDNIVYHWSLANPIESQSAHCRLYNISTYRIPGQEDDNQSIGYGWVAISISSFHCRASGLAFHIYEKPSLPYLP